MTRAVLVKVNVSLVLLLCYGWRSNNCYCAQALRTQFANILKVASITKDYESFETSTQIAEARLEVQFW